LAETTVFASACSQLEVVLFYVVTIKKKTLYFVS